MAMGEMLDYTFKVRREHKKYKLVICTKYTDAADNPMAIGDKLYNLLWIYRGTIVDIKQFNAGAVVYYKYRAWSDKVKSDFLLCTYGDGSKQFFVDFNIKSVVYCIFYLLSKITSSIRNNHILRNIIIVSSVMIAEAVILYLIHFMMDIWF